MKVAALCILALSFIIGCSEAFIARRLVVSPALFSNKILATTAPQHARVTALWDDPKGIYDVVFNAFPAALLVFAVSVSFYSQEKVLASEKEKRAEVLAAEKENLAVWKAIQEGAIATERESRKEAIAAEREDLKAALLHQNEIWSLRFENYAAKGEKFKKDDGLPPPPSPSDSKSE